MGMTSAEILRRIEKLIDYCSKNEAKRSVIIKELKGLKEDLSSILPFD